MKIGRNEQCPCGSGKKYKKCCLNKEELNLPTYNKHYFELKGKNAESFVHEIAEKSFLTDWCYENPKWEDGKELCDLLVVFDEVAIIWQIKDLKRGEDKKYNQGKVDKNLRQLIGANRKLFELKKPINLENPRKGKELFDPNSIKEVYLISALVGKGEDYFEFVKKIKNKTIHIFDRKGIKILLNELDTISDFVGYLKDKENFLSNGRKIDLMGGEEELMAYYLINGRSFNELKKAGFLFIQGGFFKDLQNRQEYLAKKEEDKISYGWDEIINGAHTCGEGYEKIARELARTNRFERRFLSKSFFDAHVTAHNETKNNVFHRIIKLDGVTYYLLFMEDVEPREKRKALLHAGCFIARGLNKENMKVIGIATEMKMRPECSYDFCLLEVPEWTDENQNEMERLQKIIGFFINPKWKHSHEDEYPNFKSKNLKTSKLLNKHVKETKK